MRKINKRGQDLVKSFEGLFLEAYLCPAGVWTISWGHTGPDVRQGMKITLEEAQAFFEQDMETFERAVERLVKVPLSDNQFAALVSFAFNCGEGALSQSTLLRLLNQGKYQEAADQLLRWVNGGGRELPGLVRRRKEERELFLLPDEIKTAPV